MFSQGNKLKMTMDKSTCCKAKIEEKGGGYDDRDIAPIKTYCAKCGKQPYFADIIWDRKDKINIEDLEF